MCAAYLGKTIMVDEAKRQSPAQVAKIVIGSIRSISYHFNT